MTYYENYINIVISIWQVTAHIATCATVTTIIYYPSDDFFLLSIKQCPAQFGWLVFTTLEVSVSTSRPRLYGHNISLLRHQRGLSNSWRRTGCILSKTIYTIHRTSGDTKMRHKLGQFSYWDSHIGGTKTRDREMCTNRLW